MAYWRMQLHPGGSKEAAKFAAQSLAAGFIGFGFATDPGDLTLLGEALPADVSKDEVEFATGMTVGDNVLVMVHHFPFALVTVAGEYNYIRERVNSLGIWFRHFRAVGDVRYYADRETNAHVWERIVMTGTIQRLQDPNSASVKLIESWS